MSGRLKGRVAIVTGAAQGIGARYAVALAAEGASVVLGDLLDASSVARTIAESGGKACAAHLDVTDALSVREMVAETLKRYGSLEILVNNAAYLAKKISAAPLSICVRQKAISSPVR